METFRIHTIETAPEKSRQALEGLERNFGFIPNAAATMAGSPALINAFIGSFGSFHGSSLSEPEKQTILLTNAVTLGCHWTTMFHSTMALRAGIPASDVSAIRGRDLPADQKLSALSGLAKALIEKKGHGVEAEVEKLMAAGYAQSHVLDVIAGIAISTMAGITASMANTPVEDRFTQQS